MIGTPRLAADRQDHGGLQAVGTVALVDGEESARGVGDRPRAVTVHRELLR